MEDFKKYLMQGLEEEVEFLPLISTDDENSSIKLNSGDVIPVLPLRNTVLFPGVVIPITVGRDKSIKAVREAYAANKIIGVLTQKDSNTEEPEFQDLNVLGTVAKIIKMLKMPDGSTTVIIQGKMRFTVQEVVATEPYFKAKVNVLPESKTDASDAELSAVISSLKDLAANVIKLSPNIPTEANIMLRNIEAPGFLVNFIANNLTIDLKEKQSILEINDLKERAGVVMKFLNNEIQLLELKNQIQTKVRTDIEKQQKEYFLNQQLKTIQEELGGDPNQQQIANLKKRAAEKKWSAVAEKQFNSELAKLERLNPNAAEFSVILNYLELMLKLPWNVFTKDNLDLKRAAKILDEDHFGLEKVKDRILEYLAVLKLKGDLKSPILCFVGPPGVGKTSLGKSIAKALKRKYVRMSLGGMHDEAEIRGHRKTYIGAMPGRVIQSLEKAESSNPVFVLDEIDKVGSDFRGDPSSALLEVLDPEQNTTFQDLYLETEYDLSKILFIATANSLQTIQPALLDRMEIIELTGYSVEEKVEIAQRHLLPKQMEAHGLKSKNVSIKPDVIQKLIEDYTRESGVRSLDRKFAAIMRNVAKQIAMGETKTKNINADDLHKILGARRFDKDVYKENNPAGVAVGLAWTSVGGEILFIETLLSKGKGNMKLTGNLGDVMKESASTAMTFLKANAEKLAINADDIDNTDVHVHVPEGATPKDGPSAGITMLTSLASAYSKRKVKPFVAMTGEITLRGKVLPVGGIKEKILAARRAGMKEIILCEMNRKDIDEINSNYITGLKFHYVNNMMEVLELALEK